MVIGDVVDLIKEDPRLIPLGIPAVFGMGLMTYETYPPEVQKFYGLFSQAEAIQGDYKELKPEEKSTFFKKNQRLIQLTPRLRQIANQISTVRKQIDTINESDLSAEEKRARLTELEQRMIKWANLGLGLFE